MATKKKVAPVTVRDAHTRFCEIMERMKGMFADRDDLIDLIALGILSKEHVFVLSPPGTAKTAVIREIAQAIDGKFFGVQMRDDTKPEEILGMWDIKALEEGRYKRKWSRAAVADILYVNEAFKGGSNALNSMLGLLNEREVDDETGYHAVPLWTALLDSNELPREPEVLAAFFDRIRFRTTLSYIESGDSFQSMIQGNSGFGNFDSLSMEDINALHKGVKAVSVWDGYAADVNSLRSHLAREGFRMSDRCWAESCGVFDHRGDPRSSPVRAMAFYEGRTAVSRADFTILADCFWTNPTDRPKILRIIQEVMAPGLRSAQKALDDFLDRVATYESAPSSSSRTNTISSGNNAIKIVRAQIDSSIDPSETKKISVIEAKLLAIQDRILRTAPPTDGGGFDLNSTKGPWSP